MSKSSRMLRTWLVVASIALPLEAAGVVVWIQADMTRVAGVTALNSDSPTTTPGMSPTGHEEPSRGLGSTIKSISVADPRAHVPGYERGCGPGEGCVFGTAWTDNVDVNYGHNGCDTRNDILGRDLKDITFEDGTRNCVVLEGTFIEPYTGRPVSFVRGANNIQIDHIVPLALAWDLGAWQWSLSKRVNFANDPLNLVAADGSANASKSDQGPGSWMPINAAFRCAYVLRIAEVALAYDLALPNADVTSMLYTASRC